MPSQQRGFSRSGYVSDLPTSTRSCHSRRSAQVYGAVGDQVTKSVSLSKPVICVAKLLVRHNTEDPIEESLEGFRNHSKHWKDRYLR